MPESRCRLTSRCYDREICQGCCIDGQTCLSTDRENIKGCRGVQINYYKHLSHYCANCPTCDIILPAEKGEGE